ncbi:hypothetical protein [Microbacterium capsulatum]|uniref:Helix-turn-helix domain-containing protein n=1 Tax=Microbacterium capsulatum TaxID=3041921 RepID=A0ABU0XL25_9MICO|nr:hypothetical protein [Microbacterium sp. ASV81]MDQ4215852.1 hypothetical protein [Microbacterium sp. ASV81]
MTCAEARRRYTQAYASRRATGSGTPIEHGTSNGYLLGCRDRLTCPGDGDGTTCSEARARYREGRARAAGIAPRVESVDARVAAAKVRELSAGGLSLRRIAALTGCGRTTIADLITGGASSTRKITPATLSRILALDGMPRAHVDTGHFDPRATHPDRFATSSGQAASPRLGEGSLSGPTVAASEMQT